MNQVVIDTNILISAFLWGGLPASVLTQCLTLNIQMLHTEATFNEFVVTLNKLKFDKQFAKRELTREGIIERWRQFSTLVSPSDVPANVVADPNDIIFLAAAAGGDADAIITGDDHLLRLITFRYSQMLTPAQFLDLINLPAEPPADAPQID